jgi:hypothetical protein
MSPVSLSRFVIALLLDEPAGLAARQLARADTLLDAFALIVLACIDARIARAARVGMACSTPHPGRR